MYGRSGRSSEVISPIHEWEPTTRRMDPYGTAFLARRAMAEGTTEARLPPAREGFGGMIARAASMVTDQRGRSPGHRRGVLDALGYIRAGINELLVFGREAGVRRAETGSRSYGRRGGNSDFKSENRPATAIPAAFTSIAARAEQGAVLDCLGGPTLSRIDAVAGCLWSCQRRRSRQQGAGL